MIQVLLSHRVIPCFDVNQGRVVKGVNFVELSEIGGFAVVVSSSTAGNAGQA